MRAGENVARNGASERTRQRVLRPAHSLADRLEAQGQHRDAQILRTLLKSHAGQRAVLQQQHRQLLAAQARRGGSTR